MKNIWSVFLGLYFIFYVCLYIGYLFYIKFVHYSYNVVIIAFVIMPFLLLGAFLKASNQGDRMTKSNFIGIMVVASIMPLCCGILLGINEYKSRFHMDRWLNDESSRVLMVDNLLEKYDFAEMPKNEVTELLGAATPTHYFKKKDNIVYYLGNERGIISIDSEWLIFKFDENEKVTSYEVKTD
jgi:hypothetical protein